MNELSDKFFMNGDHTRESLLQSRQNMAGYAGQTNFAGKGSNLADNLMNMQTAEAGELAATADKPAVESTDDLLRQMSSADSLTSAEETQLDFQQKLQALKSYGQPQKLTEQPIVAQAQTNLNANNLENLNQFENTVEPTLQAVQAKDMSAFANTGEGEQQMDNMSGNDFSAQDMGVNKATKTQGSEFMIKAPQPTETEMSENIREIINKAQVMVKKGGGEMKVSLRPEGMGNVNLKVNVVGGDVRVEMITASDETRKILEKGLGDLKDNLSLQKLNVEQIKVESMQDVADKLMEEKQEQAERHFQERFLQDFKNQNQSRFGAALGVNPVGAPETQDLEDSEGQQEARSDKSRRLDLVA